MDELKPTKSSPPKSQKIFVYKDLKSCTHVFVRVDRVRKALEPPYDGSFPVKERYEKYFTMIIKNKPVNISVDRLKPAYLLVTDSIPDKTTVPCKQSDENSAANDSILLTDDKPTVSRQRRLVKKPNPWVILVYFLHKLVNFTANLPPPKVAAPGRGRACPPLAPALLARSKTRSDTHRTSMGSIIESTASKTTTLQIGDRADQCSARMRGCGSPVVKKSDHSRHVMSSSPAPLKTCRVGQRWMLNLSRAQTSSHWCSVVVRRGGASSGVVDVT
ncbi:uncharacterized protein TNCV_1217121 [Trichonephila clavipes]|nr:uncharacterized protein TNCV_1217121 [Trichonephila clavipes]